MPCMPTRPDGPAQSALGVRDAKRALRHNRGCSGPKISVTHGDALTTCSRLRRHLCTCRESIRPPAKSHQRRTPGARNGPFAAEKSHFGVVSSRFVVPHFFGNRFGRNTSLCAGKHVLLVLTIVTDLPSYDGHFNFKLRNGRMIKYESSTDGG